MLVTARFKYVAESEWGSRRYLDVTLLEEAHREAGKVPTTLVLRRISLLRRSMMRSLLAMMTV